jgi:predicted amidohydrolase
MKVGVYQNAPRFGESRANVDRTIRDLEAVEADLMVVPELFNTGYQFVSREEVEKLSEEIPEGKTCQELMSFARSRRLYLVFGMAEREGNRFYNSSAIVGPDGFIGRYRKTHLFAEEKDFFEPGDTGFQVFDLGIAKVGIMICFDWQFPESARVLGLLGADIICHPSNLVLPFCQKAMVTRSLENGLFSATANRIGREERGGKDPLVFTGQSQILDNRGQVLGKLGEDEPGIAIVDIDVTLARNKMITTQNDRIGDRRPEFYHKLIES